MSMTAARQDEQIVVLSMLGHEVADEIAFHRQLAPLRPYRVQRRARKFGADAFPAELRRHLGMNQRDRAGGFSVGDDGGVSFNVEFKSFAGFVIAEVFGHGLPLRSG